MCVCVCIYVCVCAYMCVCVCVYVFRIVSMDSLLLFINTSIIIIIIKA